MSNRKKDKYFFNPESLQYESVRKTLFQTLKRYGTMVISTFLVAVVYYIGLSIFFDTPRERAMKRENEILEEELSKLDVKMDRLDQVVLDISKRDTNIYRAIFEANPLSASALNEANNLASLNRVEKGNTKLILETKQKLVDVNTYFKEHGLLLDSLKVLFEEKKEELKYIPAIQPVDNPDLNAVGASVGEKINPFYKSTRIHSGIDFAVPVGANVYATADGDVRETWFSQFGSGNRIVIDHGNQYETRYLYLDEVYVRRGAKVKRGQIIGKVGNLGMTVPHLHYEVRKGGKIADPLNYFFLELNPKQYDQIMAISLNNGQSLD